jgi:hypothetical protein
VPFLKVMCDAYFRVTMEKAAFAGSHFPSKSQVHSVCRPLLCSIFKAAAIGKSLRLFEVTTMGRSRAVDSFAEFLKNTTSWREVHAAEQDADFSKTLRVQRGLQAGQRNSAFRSFQSTRRMRANIVFSDAGYRRIRGCFRNPSLHSVSMNS